jgi:Family of unknown function (DUF6494)
MKIMLRVNCHGRACCCLRAIGWVEEKVMNEDRLNMDIRKFLKVVGVTSQREIENAVRGALAGGRLSESVLLKPRVTLSIPELGLEHVVDGEIGLT